MYSYHHRLTELSYHSYVTEIHLVPVLYLHPLRSAHALNAIYYGETALSRSGSWLHLTPAKVGGATRPADSVLSVLSHQATRSFAAASLPAFSTPITLHPLFPPYHQPLLTATLHPPRILRQRFLAENHCKATTTASMDFPSSDGGFPNPLSFRPLSMILTYSLSSSLFSL